MTNAPETPHARMTDDPAVPDFTDSRDAARKALSAIDPFMNGEARPDPFRRDWFNAVYDDAGGDAARVPWADLAPHPLTAEWIAARGASLRGLAALDVGCGLGDNAEAFATADCRTSAFDLVPRAVDWARQRFPASTVDYRTADLFDLPAEWRGAFDLVHECYTLQALPSGLIPAAAAALAGALKPGGTVLIVARARADGAAVSGPPWPLCRADLDAFTAAGLRAVEVEDCPARQDLGRHWRALFEKAAT